MDWKIIRPGREAIRVKVTPEQWDVYLSLSVSNCEHFKSELRARTVQGGGIQWREQCLTCGKSTSNAFKRDPKQSVPDWDESLEANYESSVANKREQLEEIFIEQTLSIESGEDVTYQEYLKSEEWRRKRALVLKRDKHQCQGCLTAEATEVHHLNYDDVPDEMMFDLVSLCSACHKRVHRKKLARLEKLKKAEAQAALK